MPDSEGVPASTSAAYKAVVALTEPFCKERLDDEYASLSRRLTAALARKRPSPLVRGKPEMWACGVVHALGMVNFLFDDTQTPHLLASQLYAAFGVSSGAGVSKSKHIRDLFGMYSFDPRWFRPSQFHDNPCIWTLHIDGFLIDVRMLPREAQVIVHEKGLIPYVPADREPNFMEAELERRTRGRYKYVT